jgi:hypothetical protein
MRIFSGTLTGALFLWAAAANAIVIVKRDGGGIIRDYLQYYQTIRASGDEIRIDGKCYSACTIFTGVIPSWRVCVTDRAELGFHSARYSIDNSYAEEATMEMWEAYPPRLRKMLMDRGWSGQEHPDLIVIRGDDLQTLGYRKCGESSWITRVLDFIERLFG